MKYSLLALCAAILLNGCNDTTKKVTLDGEKLIHQKCAACHNLDLPPKTSEDEKAPPMMAVAFHVADFVKVSNESERIPKAIAFVKDYVIHPSASKSFCDKKSLQQYGVMPSQKGNVTEDELDAIAHYMFEHYTVKNLNEAQAIANKMKHMPQGEKLALKYNCLGCHRKDQDLVGPSFARIAAKYDVGTIQNAILDGSQNKWSGIKGKVMPAFAKQMNKEDALTLAKWIKTLH